MAHPQLVDRGDRLQIWRIAANILNKQSQTADHQCGVPHDRSTDHIFCIHQILERKREYSGTKHQLFIDFKKAYDSLRREVLYNILSEFRIPRKLVGLIKIFVNET
jgi:hypothetical protein